MSFLPQSYPGQSYPAQGHPADASSGAGGAFAPLPDQVRDGSAAGLRYHIVGGLVPTLVLELQPSQSVYFEHHILLWKNPALQVRLRPLRGMVKRLIAGQDLLVTEAWGPGQIAFSRKGVGQVFPMLLAPGQGVLAREHQFLAASGEVEFTWERVRGVSNLLFGGTGFFIDHFIGGPAGGVVWLHGHGNVFERRLEAGEQLDVEPGAWVYRDPSVGMETVYQGLSTGMLGASGLTCQRFTGPGRVGIQSGSGLLDGGTDSNTATAQGAVEAGGWAIAGSVLGGLLGGKRG